MLILIAIVIAIAAAGHIWIESRGGRRTDAIPASVVRRVEVVCMDCSGTCEPPARTNMTREGRCQLCGGSAVLLASSIFEARRFAGVRAIETGRQAAV